MVNIDFHIKMVYTILDIRIFQKRGSNEITTVIKLY